MMLQAIVVAAAFGGVTGIVLAKLGRRELQSLYRGRDRRIAPVPWIASPLLGMVAGAGAAIAGLDQDTSIGIAGVAAALGLVAVVDMRRRLIPDVAVLAIAFQGLYDAAVSGRALEALMASAMSASIILVPLALDRFWGGTPKVGLGDLKLAASIGAWLGPMAPAAILAGSLVGTAFWLARSARGGCSLRWRIPYGTALAGGVAVTVAWHVVQRLMA